MTFSVNWPVLNTTMPEADFLNIIASNGFYNQELKYQGEDIHLLRNNTDFDLSTYFKKRNGIAMSFSIPLVDQYDTSLSIYSDSGTMFYAGAYSPSAGEYEFNNIILKEATGIINANTAPNDYLRNFVLRVNLVFKYNKIGGGIETVQKSLFIRVHLHNSVSKIWLTPNPISIYNDSDSVVKCHLYAKFDDGVIGDISSNHTIAWSVSSTTSFSITQYAPTATPAVYTNGNLKALTTTVGTTGQITAAYGGMSSTATVKVKESLAINTNRPSFELLSGAGSGELNNLVNIVILSDGFETDIVPADDRKNAFEKFTKTFVDDVKTNSKLSPWNKLFDNMNIWRCFVPTDNKIITVGTTTSKIGNSASYEFEFLPITWTTSVPYSPKGMTPLHRYIDAVQAYCEGKLDLSRCIDSSAFTGINSFLSLSGSAQLSFPIPTTRTTSTQYKFTQMIEWFGMPTQSDISKSFADKITEWAAVNAFNSTVISALITSDMYDLWRAMAFRLLVHKSDTPFALTVGHKPAFEGNHEYLIPDSYRMNKEYLNKIVSNAKENGTSTVIGNVWDNASGKDRNNIMFLSTAYNAGHASSNREGYLSVSAFESPEYDLIPLVQDTNNEYYATRSRSPLQKVVNGPFNVQKMPLTLQLKILHEMGHLIGGLNDEYGGNRDYSKYEYKALQKLKDIGNGGLVNTQFEEDVVVAGPPQKIDGDKIRWRWLRYQAVLILNAEPSTSLELTFKSNKDMANIIKNFAVDDIVFLRKRQLENVNVTNQTPTPLYSCKLKIVNLSPFTVTKVNTTDTLTVTDWSAGSLLVKPIADPFYTSTKYAELISSRVIEYFNGKNNKDVFKSLDAVNNIQKPDSAVITALKSVGSPPINNKYFRNKNLERLGGLYYHGADSFQNIFHPFGYCIMRAAAEETYLLTNFMCPVCQYLLAEKIAPTVHSVVDANYNPYYPKP